MGGGLLGGVDGARWMGGSHDWWVMLCTYLPSEVAGRDGEVSFGGQFAVGWEFAPVVGVVSSV